ncbi:hypothetical protein ACFU8T_12025 [Sphingobacterium spiritivorum]|uniref:Porin n=1 Tax=Sphingobacterium spiritivorum ATCC 33861 TaxID=525373 RepID=D7VKM9_SPHSI|nr:hypothetical protein [Sphingobacterium spiritivorum]EFK58831.1 hypothetical protein HMPREF0766_11548 [Sphingobacterium spiritivorum ATCC 33861]QQT34290.1 hypothetical protein I6J01_13210 [Sphingobacterium spiritivorum]WQD35132.1 hypothetical protein U0038_05155 [Sphingobacterium spiritivorum]SUI99435.1 Uncharacterised protein [Sphingobacterium spiritivorum]
MVRRLITSLLLLLLYTNSNAQNVGYQIDFLGYADNREFKAPYTESKTIFGTRISPELYFKLSDNHTVHGGIHVAQEFGEREHKNPMLRPIIYYNYKNENFDFSIGHIPRYDLMKNTPRAILNDTLIYFRPNIEGMMLAYRNDHFQQRLFIDWTSKQSDKYREEFLVGMNGKVTVGDFYFSDDLILWHNALSANSNIDEHIQDNGVGIFKLGSNLTNKTPLDSLIIDAGIMMGIDRIRSQYDFRVKKGFIANVYMAFKSFSLENTFYKGGSQNTPYADSYYRYSTYDRLDVGWSPIQSANIQGTLKLALHFTPGRIDNQQMFTLRYLLNRAIRVNKK